MNNLEIALEKEKIKKIQELIDKLKKQIIDEEILLDSYEEINT